MKALSVVAALLAVATVAMATPPKIEIHRTTASHCAILRNLGVPCQPSAIVSVSSSNPDVWAFAVYAKDEIVRIIPAISTANGASSLTVYDNPDIQVSVVALVPENRFEASFSR